MLSVVIKSFSYDEIEVLRDLEFEVGGGKHLSVLGESGCGKSTLLHLIYGLLHLEHGALFWKNRPMLGPRHNLVPGEPFIKLVAQEYDLMPHTTVAENIATYLPRIELNADRERVLELLQIVGLIPYQDTKIKRLSGGQKQRVALAKALALEPELLLLDEPFSHIDSFRKNALRRALYEYLKSKNISCITATHDSQEALAFSDEILMLKDGRVELKGTPEEVYAGAKTPYQLSFFGEVNQLPQASSRHIWSHQLMPSTKKTPIEVSVIHSYFMGTHYLVRSKRDGEEVLFHSKEKIPAGSSVFLSQL